jgi:hypothetical protein
MVRTEREKMLAGELYHAIIPELTTERDRCFAACQKYNNSDNSISELERKNLFRKSLPPTFPLSTPH